MAALMEIIMSTPRWWRGVDYTNIYQVLSCSICRPLNTYKYLWARYKFISLLIHTTSKYCGSIGIPRGLMAWWSPRVQRAYVGELRRPISSLRSGLYMVPPWKVSLRLSQSGRALAVHGTLSYSGTIPVLHQLHQQIDRLTIILLPEVIRDAAARNISSACAMIVHARPWPPPGWCPVGAWLCT